MVVIDLLTFYLLCGLLCGAAFVLFGVGRALGHPMKVSAGARLILLPGAIVLWPVVLCRWLRTGRGA